MKVIAGAALAALCLLTVPAAARPSEGNGGCSFTNDGRTVCFGAPVAASKQAETGARYITYSGKRYQRAARVSALYVASDITYIPNPVGTWRVALSCAHRLAAYWGLGTGLDKVSTWEKRFPRAAGPGEGVAAIRNDRHHVLGITGGGHGGWNVVDFNSGGHKNRAYTVADFRGYFFVNTRGSSRVAHQATKSYANAY